MRNNEARNISPATSPFTYGIGRWYFSTLGEYTAEIYTVDAKGNESNTVSADFMVAAGNTDPKSVTINNITLTGRAGVWVFAELPQGNANPTNVAIMSGNIADDTDTLTVGLRIPYDNTWNSKPDGTPQPKWTGNGDHYVAIVPIIGNSYQFNLARIYAGDGNTPEKVTFDQASILLDFDEFMEISKM